MHTACYPDWHYTPLQIDNLEQIRSELEHLFNDLYTPGQPVTFINFDHNTKHWQRLLALQQWLDNTNRARDRWINCYFSASQNGLCPIHVDYTSEHKFLAINIPVLNCDNSWIAWYDTNIEVNNPIKAVQRGNNTNELVIFDEHTYQDVMVTPQSFWCDQEHAREIDRASCDQPMMINNTVPHRPIVAHDRLRVMFSLRLTPASFEHDVMPFL